jgi:hypothetical protein
MEVLSGALKKKSVASFKSLKIFVFVLFNFLALKKSGSDQDPMSGSASGSGFRQNPYQMHNTDIYVSKICLIFKVFL